MAEGGISNIVTDYDSVWEYAKQGDNFLTRRKGSDSWITATGDSATSIARGVYNLDENNETIPATPYVNPTPVLKDMEKSEDPVKKNHCIFCNCFLFISCLALETLSSIHLIFVPEK